jgi:hypothetical protein
LEKVTNLEQDLRLKNSKILGLETEARNASNTSDSTILAKDSLIRSYENEIKNLKQMMQEIRFNTQNVNNQNISRIKEL